MHNLPAHRFGIATLVLVAASIGAAQVQSLDEILANHLEARGGLERLRALQSVRMSGTATSGPGRTARVSREIQSPGMIRTEFEFQGATAVYACDGTECWSIEPLSGNLEPQTMPAERAAQAIQQADIVGPLVDSKAKGYELELVGKEVRDGRAVFRIRSTHQDGLVRDDLIDGETWLVVATESTRFAASREVEVETAVGDYRPIDGIQFPHAFTIREKGSEDDLEVTVESVELDPTLDRGRFAMPDVSTGQ